MARESSSLDPMRETRWAGGPATPEQRTNQKLRSAALNKQMVLGGPIQLLRAFDRFWVSVVVGQENQRDFL